MKIIHQVLDLEQERIARQILERQLPGGGCVILLGEHGMGKTHVLKKVNDLVAAPLALVSLSDFHTDEELIHTLSRQLNDRDIEKTNKSPIPFTSVNLWEQFETEVEQLSKHLMPITFLFDDAHLLERHKWGANFFRQLPRLLNKGAPVHIILGGDASLMRWAKGLKGKHGLLDNAAPLIQLRQIDAHLVFDALDDYPEIAQRILDLCGGHPYCLSYITEKLPENSSTSVLNQSIDVAVQTAQLNGHFDSIFRPYWGTFSSLARQVCFLLSVHPLGLEIEDARSFLDQQDIGPYDLTNAIEQLNLAGVLLWDQDGKRMRLIGLFRKWYQMETGQLETFLKPDGDKTRVSGMVKTHEHSPFTELTFLPDEKTVLVKRDHYLSKSDLGVETNLIRYSKKCDKVPSAAISEFAENLTALSQDLWEAFGREDWLSEVRRSVDEHHRIRFYFPSEMMGFPFEMLPLDNTGTRRIGSFAPISRQLFKHGRHVDRAPLMLPLDTNRNLKILVVVADVNSKIGIDRYGEIRSGNFLNSTDTILTLSELNLEGELIDLYEAFAHQTRIGTDVTYLTHSRALQGVARCETPSIKMFEDLLSKEQFDVIHFSGHGIYSEQIKGLFFPDGGLLALNKLKGLLDSQKQLRFIYLSCCESGRMDVNEYGSNLLGLAQTCIEAGVPAVLSMRWQIPTGVSKRLAQAFYPAFFTKGFLDQAVFDASKKLSEDRDFSVYSSVPVLIMH